MPPNWPQIICPLISFPDSRACFHHFESITDSRPYANLYSLQIFQNRLEMCQRQYSNCKYLESSSPFIFVSVINLQNSTHLSPTHPGFTDAICLCLSTEVPKPLLTLIFDVCCHPTYFQCTPCQRPLSRHWGTAVTVGHCGAYTGVNSQWPSSGQLAREVPMSKWGREE